MERQNNCEPGLLAPPKRRKTAAVSGNWRATASQNLNQPNRSSPASGQMRKRNRNQNQSNHQKQQYSNLEPSEKSTADDTDSREAFIAFLQDLLEKKVSGAKASNIIFQCIMRQFFAHRQLWFPHCLQLLKGAVALMPPFWRIKKKIEAY